MKTKDTLTPSLFDETQAGLPIRTLLTDMATNRPEEFKGFFRDLGEAIAKAQDRAKPLYEALATLIPAKDAAFVPGQIVNVVGYEETVRRWNSAQLTTQTEESTVSGPFHVYALELRSDGWYHGDRPVEAPARPADAIQPDSRRIARDEAARRLSGCEVNGPEYMAVLADLNRAQRALSGVRPG